MAPTPRALPAAPPAPRLDTPPVARDSWGMTEPTHTVIGYLYRDAANYKVHDSVLLDGVLTEAEIAEIWGKLEGGMWFVPEQVGLPPLQSALYEFSDGPTDDDHAFHELVEIRAVATRAVVGMVHGPASEVLARFRGVTGWVAD